MNAVFRCGRFSFATNQPHIMAVLNITPDSFSGDGLAHRHDAWLAQAERAVRDGAHMLDVGGESSRPGAEPVSEQAEIDRVVPVVEALVAWDVPVSVDTVKPAVMREAIAAGASMINDINALRSEGALAAVAGTSAGICLMHMQGTPRTMQHNPDYRDVVVEVRAALAERAAAARAAGVAAERIMLDPGFGFGKTLAHNLALFRALGSLSPDYPMLAGVSRKSMLGAITGQPVDGRTVASAVAAALAVQAGACWVRVHDVAETRDALAVFQAAAAVPDA